MPGNPLREYLLGPEIDVLVGKRCLFMSQQCFTALRSSNDQQNIALRGSPVIIYNQRS
jgi:hypothetical protein